MDSNFNNDNKPWELSLEIDDSDLHLTPVLHPSSSTRFEPTPLTPNTVRIIPSPAGTVHQATPSRTLMSTQDYMQKVVEDIVEDDDFNNIEIFLKKGKLDQVVAIVKSCSPNVLGDLTVTMKDLSGIIPGTVHHKVIGEGGYGKDITARAALILANVSVLLQNHQCITLTLQ
nr:hypothetical protein [Tanacetum cinerariifolium]